MTDPEAFDWKAISRDWHAQPPAPVLTALQTRLRRDTRRMAAATALDVVVGLSAAALVAGFTLANPTPVVIGAAAALLAVNVMIAIFSIRNRMGIWRASTATPAGCVALIRARARATIHSARFTASVVVAQAAAVVTYVGARAGGRDLRPAMVAAATALAAVVAAAYLVAARRQAAAAHRALAEVAEIERLLRVDADAPPENGQM